MHTVSNSLLSRLLCCFTQTEQFAFFDTSRPTEDNTVSYLFTSPLRRLQCDINGDAEAFLATVRQWSDRGYYLAGWFAYEFGGLLAGYPDGLTSGPQKKLGGRGFRGL